MDGARMGERTGDGDSKMVDCFEIVMSCLAEYIVVRDSPPFRKCMVTEVVSRSCRFMAVVQIDSSLRVAILPVQIHGTGSLRSSRRPRESKFDSSMRVKWFTVTCLLLRFVTSPRPDPWGSLIRVVSNPVRKASTRGPDEKQRWNCGTSFVGRVILHVRTFSLLYISLLSRLRISIFTYRFLHCTFVSLLPMTRYFNSVAPLTHCQNSFREWKWDRGSGNYPD